VVAQVFPAQRQTVDALANYCPANLNELNTTARAKPKSGQRGGVAAQTVATP
jgi:hypothetical protein